MNGARTEVVDGGPPGHGWHPERPALLSHLVLGLLGAVGLASFVAFYGVVTPYATLDFRLSREAVVRRAKTFLERQGFNLEGYDHAIALVEDEAASHYLQRTLGLARTNELARSQVPLWYWNVRWFRPLQEEEFAVGVTPAGALLRFAHLLPEDAPGAHLTPPQARERAVSFLRQQGIPLREYRPQAAETERRRRRTDHRFTWQHRGPRLGEAERRVSVTVVGGSVGSYLAWLKTPTLFWRAYARERSGASLLASISGILEGLLLLSAFGGALWAFRAWTLNGKIVGVGLMIALLLLLHTVNWTPLWKQSYPTTQRWGAYLLGQAMGSLFYGGQMLLLIVVVGLAGEAFARRVWPSRRKLLLKGAHPWTALAASSFRGLALAGLHLGFLTGFMGVAQHCQAWYPLQADYSNLYSTAAPWIAPLLTGLKAAVNEEFLFRLFAISFLWYLTRRWWVALLVPAGVWAFLHSTYLTAPIYLRGIELTLVGLGYGYFFVRYDVLTTIVAHFTYNAVVVGLPLLRSDEPYFFYSGLAVAAMPVLPLLPGLVVEAQRWRSGAGREPAVPNIRPATADDWLWLAAHREGEEPPGANASFWQELQRAPERPDRQVLCADWQGQPVGYIVGRLEGGEPPVGRIEALWVARAYRRRGWGSALFARLADWLRQQGATSLKVEAPALNTAAKAFWLAQGFSPTQEVLTRELQG